MHNILTSISAHKEKTVLEELSMEAALEVFDEKWKDIEEKEGSARKSTTFTDIYELISHNKTMVRSEWAVLLKLVQKKYMECTGGY
jgi:hypothetical protein